MQGASGKPPVFVIVWLLGLTQIIGYGTLYYGFAILADDIGRTFEQPSFWIYGALSLALLSGAAVAPAAGRRMDRYGAATVMALGSFGAALALGMVAVAPSFAVFVLGLAAVEIVSTFVLYNAAFAYLVQVSPEDGHRRITHLTLIAGFASTIFWPLTSALHGIFSWHEVFGLFALANLVVCLPVHLWLRTIPRCQAAAGYVQPVAKAAMPEAVLPPEAKTKALVLVALGFAFSGFLLSGILAQMVPLLAVMGLGSSKVLVSTLFGPAQVLARLVNMAGDSGRHPLIATILASALLPLAVLVLTVSAPTAGGAVAFSLLLGFGSGLKSIMQGTLPLVLFGMAGYGGVLGRIWAAQLVSAAFAPFFLAFVIDHAGPTTALCIMMIAGVTGIAAFALTGRLISPNRWIGHRPAQTLDLSGNG